MVKYTGKPFDDEGGFDLYYYGARYYDPDRGFISVDPLASKYPSWSPYVYTLDNPIKFVDPDGRFTAPVRNPTLRAYYSGKTTKRVFAPNKSRFGLTRKGGRKMHRGVDLRAKKGTAAVAVEDGKVTDAFAGPVGGKQVIIEFGSNDGQKRYAAYMHLDEVYVVPGQSVTEGQVIGATGQSGNASDLPEYQAHLHFEIRHQNTRDPLSGRDNPEDYFYIQQPIEIPEPIDDPDIDQDIL